MDQQIAGLAEGRRHRPGSRRRQAAGCRSPPIKARDSVTGPVFIVAEALGKGRTLADVQAWPERIGAVTAADVLAAAAQICGRRIR